MKLNLHTKAVGRLAIELLATMFTYISSKFLVYYVARTCRTTYTKAAKAIDREPAPHTEHA